MEARMSNIERRYTLVPVELRARGEQRTIGGYAAVFNDTSQNLGGFVETVMPGAFNNNRARGWPDVIARYNHDNNMLLGTIGGGTLRLDVDETGLMYEVTPPDARSDVVELVERGDVRKSSFAFRLVENGDDWTMSDQGYPQRNLLEVQLVDVAPVNLPAYTNTTAEPRSIDGALESLANKMSADIEEVRKLAGENELRRFFVRTDGPSVPKAETFGAAALLELQAKADIEF